MREADAHHALKLEARMPPAEPMIDTPRCRDAGE